MRRPATWLAWSIGTATFLHFWARTLADPDMWGHLEWGREMLRTGGLPRVDRHSYTAAGQPFFDHEWLADLVFAFLFDSLGSGGLVALKLGLGVLMMVGILDALGSLRARLRAPAPSPLVDAGVLVLALAVIAPGATFRPQLFTMAGLAIQWALLERATARLGREDGRVGWEAWCVAPLMLVWANAHGGFLVGVGLMGVFTLAASWHVLTTFPAAPAAPAVPAARRARTLVALAGAGLAVLVAPIANPYGADLYLYLARTIDDHAAISEWFPVPVLSLAFARFKLLVLAVGIAGAASWRRLGTWDGAWRVGFLSVAALLAFRHQRHTVLFAIAAAPLLAVLIGDLLARLSDRPHLGLGLGARRAIAVGIAMLAGMQLGGVARTFLEHGLAIRFARIVYPVDAAAFLEVNDFRGNVAVPFDWGSYTAHTLGDRMKVFIDGRFEAVFPPEVIHDYFAFVHGTPGWQRLLDAYPTDIVVTQRARGTHERMLARQDFVYVYSDPAAFVFVRRSPRTAEALDRLLGMAVAARPPLPERAAVFP